jgi:archaellin
MNTLTATGKIGTVETKHTQTGRTYLAFTILIPVKSGFKEVELKKWCVLWLKDDQDERLHIVKEGTHVLANGILEAYEKESGGKTWINEKFNVKDIEQIAPSLAFMGEKHDKEELPF